MYGKGRNVFYMNIHDSIFHASENVRINERDVLSLNSRQDSYAHSVLRYVLLFSEEKYTPP